MKEQLYFLILQKWKYWIPLLVSKFITKPQNKTIGSVCYVAREKDKDWIFGAKVRRLSKYSGLNAFTYFNNKLGNIPKADGYYFIYQNYFCRGIRSTPGILKKKNIVMFTHPNWTKKYSKTHVIWCLKKADYVICLNSEIKKYLISAGLEASKLVVLHIATSSAFFTPHKRGQGKIGFCSAYHKRKNPKLIHQIVKQMRHREFCLIGQNWELYQGFNELKSLPNFTYLSNRDYDEYPSLYDQIDVFVSPSILEGGPVPLLEAMMANCVPVASRTGFAPDIIEHGKTGFLFEIDASSEDVISLIEKAFKLKGDIRKSVLPYTWQNCSKSIDSLFLN